VIDQHAWQAQEEFELNQFAIQTNLVFRADALTDVRRLAIDADAPGNDPFLEFAPRTIAGIGQRLVQFGRIDEDGVIAMPGVGRQRRTAARTRRFRTGSPRRPLR
jgi:hypothetical protein